MPISEDNIFTRGIQLFPPGEEEAYSESLEDGRKEGFLEGYKTAQQEVENLIQPYRFDPILWDKIIKWAQNE